MSAPRKIAPIGVVMSIIGGATSDADFSGTGRRRSIPIGELLQDPGIPEILLITGLLVTTISIVWIKIQ